jgi:hypothetical protein
MAENKGSGSGSWTSRSTGSSYSGSSSGSAKQIDADSVLLDYLKGSLQSGYLQNILNKG